MNAEREEMEQRDQDNYEEAKLLELDTEIVE